MNCISRQERQLGSSDIQCAIRRVMTVERGMKRGGDRPSLCAFDPSAKFYRASQFSRSVKLVKSSKSSPSASSCSRGSAATWA